MKTKKLTIFARIFSMIMIFCFAFLGVGCMGDMPGGDDGFDDIFKGFNMHGSRVLYRPDEYNFDEATGTTDYYGRYSWIVLNELLNTYAFADPASIDAYLPELDENNIALLYDSVRYKTNLIGTVNKSQTGDTTTDLGESSQHMIIGADTTNSWNWTFDYDTSSFNESMNAILVSASNSYVNENQYFNTSFANLAGFASAGATKYSDADFKAKYKTIYLGSQASTETANYSDYVKTLEYAIYCYALGITPGQVNVAINNSPSASTPYYTVEVVETNGSSTTTLTPAEALSEKKDLFKTHGSHVGLTQTNMADIASWILDNVIGASEQIGDDNLQNYGSVTKVEGSLASYSFNSETLTTSTFGRNYADAIEKILQASAKQVAIGKVGEVDVTIDQPYLASEVTEYAGNDFFIAGDENFPASGFEQSGTIRPLEYQSVTIMMKEPLELIEIWVALKYDADGDGTQKDVWDQSKYLDIIVDINYFSNQNQKVYKLGSQQTRIYDGPYDAMTENGLLMFGDFEDNCPDAELKTMLRNGALTIGEFKHDIGKFAQNPMLLTGSTDARTYYSLDVSAENEVGEGKAYRSGRVNEEKFKGAEGCDYLEITYKVIKDVNDFDKNYKFYTGISAMFDYFEY